MWWDTRKARTTRFSKDRLSKSYVPRFQFLNLMNDLRVPTKMLIVAILAGCSLKYSPRLQHFVEIPRQCIVVDTFTILSLSRRDAIRELRNLSVQGLSTSQIDEYLSELQAIGFVMSEAEYLEHDESLKEMRRIEEQNPGVIFDWIPTGYIVPDGVEPYRGVLVSCTDSDRIAASIDASRRN